jgi:hypothetical protein
MLQGKVVLTDGTDVRIIKREYPIDKTPCLTIDDSGGTAIIQKKIINKDYLIDGEMVSQQVIREQRSISLNLSAWCDTEDERDEITDKIRDIFYKLQSDYYEYCTRFNDGDCTYLGEKCKVSDDTMRGVKGQCPKPVDYGYQNLFNRFDIIRSSFDVEPDYILDDNTTKPPTLRSIIPVTFMYYNYHNIGGKPINTLTFDEEVL